MADRYDPKTIEPKWQKVWADEGTWEVSNEPDDEREKYYVLEMLPYPSGEPHIGHLKNYSVGDAVAHFQRRTGHRVLHPMGYDAFGLNAENHAIKTGQHPRESTETSIAEFRRQFKDWGISIDWTREFGTHEPRYYRWTQWIFLRLFERGLAYRKEAAVKWCPKDQTVLANEQVIEGRCERCGTLVEVRQLEQWFFKITDYADRLLEDMKDIEWPPHVLTMQENWIGRSEGAEVVFRCEELGTDYPVFTTRPDTLFGATFFVLAPEHPDVFRMNDSPEVHDYVNRALNESAEERGVGAQGEDRRGARADRHESGERRGDPGLRGRLRADGVRHRARSWPCPRTTSATTSSPTAFDLPIRPGRSRADEELPYPGDGPMTNSGRFDGLHNREGYAQIVEWLEAEGKGKAAVSYRLRDWLLSRQRYWGCPIPIVYCEKCGLVPVPDEQLPVELPDIEDYAPKGRSPLAAAEDWVRTECPKCGGEARRETDTMDTFVDSSWYFLRYCDALNDEAAVGPRGPAHVDARRPVHRRRRARDPAPAVRALLRQGARGHGPARRAGAVRAPLHPGHGHPRRARRCRRPRATWSAPRSSSSATAPTRCAATSSTSATPRREATGPTRGSTACSASSPACGQAAQEAPEAPNEPEGEPSAAACERRTGRSTRSRATWASASPPTRRSPP